jgi:rubredoxin
LNQIQKNRSTQTRKKGGETMARYVCQVCGYVYDPAQGDPDNGVAPGTPFEKLPDSWECPVCGASKADFAKEA